MKKILLALTVTTALTGSAFAADMAPRTYTKAPAPVMTPSWTGGYIFGGAGYGMSNIDAYSSTYPAGSATSTQQTYGGSGYYGTVGAGYDWQFSGSWVAGVFADGTFGSIRGTVGKPNVGGNGVFGTEKEKDSWSVGVRAGYLVAPNVYSYVNGGYTGADWSSATLYDGVTGGPSRTTPSFTTQGWFLGGGVENSLNIFGIAAPGWFMKTEYRSSTYNRKLVPDYAIGATTTAFGISEKTYTQTVSTSLVYRFNWTGPVVAKY